jgi:hypothetical protein
VTLKPERNLRFETTIVKIMAYCKERGLEAHSRFERRGEELVFTKRQPKHSRLTGEKR